jgi:hypothetical protein
VRLPTSPPHRVIHRFHCTLNRAIGRLAEQHGQREREARAYLAAVARFTESCQDIGILNLADVVDTADDLRWLDGLLSEAESQCGEPAPAGVT